MLNLPGPGMELVFPALAGGFLSTAPPGKSSLLQFMKQEGSSKAVQGTFFLWNSIWLFPPQVCRFIEEIRSDQIRSVAQSCPTLCDPMNPSTPGLPVHHQLPEFTETHVQRVSDAIQPSHPLSSPSPLAPNPSQHQSLFQWVNSSHEVVKILDFQL